MSTLPEKIAEKFLEELSHSDDVTEAQIQALRELMQKGTKLKPADLEAIFAPPVEPSL